MDMEHSGANFDTIKTQTQLCRGIDLVPMARVPANQYTYIARALDCGVMGIMAPMVGSAEEAEFIVSCTRYPPKGRRGAAFGFTADDYLGGSVTDIIKVADERTLVMCLIETAARHRERRQDRGGAGRGRALARPFRSHQLPGHSRAVRPPEVPGRAQEDDRGGQEARQGPRLHDGRRQLEPGVLGPGVPAVRVGVDNFLLQSAIRSGMKTLHALAAKPE